MPFYHQYILTLRDIPTFSSYYHLAKYNRYTCNERSPSVQRPESFSFEKIKGLGQSSSERLPKFRWRFR